MRKVHVPSKKTQDFTKTVSVFCIQGDSRLFAVLSRALFVCLIRFKNKTLLSRVDARGNFLIILRSGLFTELVTSRFQHSSEIETGKTTLKKPHERMMYLPCNTRNFFKAIDKATGKIIAYLLALTKAKSVGVNKNPCRDFKHIQAMVITEICRP